MWNGKCRLCRKADGEYEIKGGRICRHCLSRMPESVQRAVWRLTGKELAQLNRQIIEPEIEEQIGILGIGRYMISINGRGMRLTNLKRMSLNFHPLAQGKYSGTVVGKITILVELVRPHILIEEPLMSQNITVFYHISKREVTYEYPNYIEQPFRMLQECLEKRTFDMESYLEKVRSIRKEQAEKEEKRRRAEAEKAAKEAQKRAEETGKKAGEGKRSRVYSDCGDALLRKARIILQVEMPYTKKELSEQRRRLMKKCHPDMGGSEEKAKKINEAYDLLFRYARI